MEKMLNLDHVNADDNFFDLGGDSVIAIQLMSRINKRFSVEISPRRFFEEPTVASLARIIEEAKCVRGLKERPSLVKVPRGGKLPLSYAQQRLWYLCKADPSNSSYNIPKQDPAHRKPESGDLSRLPERDRPTSRSAAYRV